MEDGTKTALRRVVTLRERLSRGKSDPTLHRHRLKIFKQFRGLGIEVDRLAYDDASVRRAVKALKGMHAEMLLKQPRSTSKPTPERVRQAMGDPVEIDNGPALPKAHVFPRPIETLGWLSAEEYAVADRLQKANEILHGASLIGGYDGTSGGGGYRPGKLELTERQQTAGAFRAAMVVGWTPAKGAALRNFIFEQPPEGQSRCLSWEEFGYAYCHTKNRQVASHSAKLVLKILCGELAMRARVWGRDQSEVRRKRENAA